MSAATMAAIAAFLGMLGIWVVLTARLKSRKVR